MKWNSTRSPLSAAPASESQSCENFKPVEGTGVVGEAGKGIPTVSVLFTVKTTFPNASVVEVQAAWSVLVFATLVGVLVEP